MASIENSPPRNGLLHGSTFKQLRSEPRRILDSLASCQCVFCSSLHRVMHLCPCTTALPIALGDRITGCDFKYVDYIQLAGVVISFQSGVSISRSWKTRNLTERDWMRTVDCSCKRNSLTKRMSQCGRGLEDQASKEATYQLDPRSNRTDLLTPYIFTWMSRLFSECALYLEIIERLEVDALAASSAP